MNGDEVENIRSAVRAVLRRLVGAEDPEYEDLVQSALANVLATIGRGKFRGECPPGGWAAVIARNVAIDAIRARSRERQLFARDAADATAAEGAHGPETKIGPEHLTGVQERLARVQRALLGLTAHKANVIYLHDVLGHELDAVAGILKISVAAAQSRLVRGRREIIARVDAADLRAKDLRNGTDRTMPARGPGAPPRGEARRNVVTAAGRAHLSAGRKQPRRGPPAMLS
jgi:RNA polymerase sigma-70 factor (ECF subfamily)